MSSFMVYPAILTEDNKLVINNNGNGTITIASQQKFFIHDVLVQTDSFQVPNRTLSHQANKQYHLRYSLNGADFNTLPVSQNTFYLADLSSGLYNPNAYEIDHADFKNKTDDLLIAHVVTDGSNVPTITAIAAKGLIVSQNVEKLTDIIDIPDDHEALEILRRNATDDGYEWVPEPEGGGGIADAPSDGKIYGRKNAAWVEVTASAPSYPTNGLIMNCPGDLSGGSLIDTVGSYTRAPTAGTFTNTSGVLGNAVSFNGSTYINYGQNVTAFNLQNFSISVFVKFLGDFSNRTIFTNYVSASPYYGFLFNSESSGKIRFTCYNNAIDHFVSIGTMTLGTTYHVVVTRESATNTSRIYINGALDSSKVVGLGYNGNQYVTMGCYAGSGGTPLGQLNGSLNLFKFYNRTLSDAEVTQLYNGGQGA